MRHPIAGLGPDGFFQRCRRPEIVFLNEIHAAEQRQRLHVARIETGSGLQITVRLAEVVLPIEQVSQKIIQIRIRRRQLISRIQSFARVLQIPGLEGRNAMLEFFARLGGHCRLGYVEVRCLWIAMQRNLYPIRVCR